MRKISKQAAEAFMNDRPFNKSNTEVAVSYFPAKPQTALILFGNIIAVKSGGEISITNAGWKSNTTKERLNAIPGVHIVQNNFVWYLNGEEWDGKPISVQS